MVILSEGIKLYHLYKRYFHYIKVVVDPWNYYVQLNIQFCAINVANPDPPGAAFFYPSEPEPEIFEQKVFGRSLWSAVWSPKLSLWSPNCVLELVTAGSSLQIESLSSRSTAWSSDKWLEPPIHDLSLQSMVFTTVARFKKLACDLPIEGSSPQLCTWARNCALELFKSFGLRATISLNW